MTREELEERLRGEGYGIGVPAGLGPAHDRARAAELSCRACGRVGVEYLPFIKPGSYVRAYACSCGAAVLEG